MKVKDIGDGCYSFYCPGCQCEHVYYVTNPHINGSQWEFNGDVNNPTFNPSLLNTWGKYADENYKEPVGEEIVPPRHGWSGRCHLFVMNGVINYCSDCTHDYNCRQGVPMKEY